MSTRTEPKHYLVDGDRKDKLKKSTISSRCWVIFASRQKPMTQRPVFEFHVNDRPFRAIRDGTKKVEVRANRIQTIITSIKSGDVILFKNIISQESFPSIVSRITLYRTVRQLLETEGTEKTLSSKGTLEEGIKSIESISDYESVIRERGVFAIILE